MKILLMVIVLSPLLIPMVAVLLAWAYARAIASYIVGAL